MTTKGNRPAIHSGTRQIGVYGVQRREGLCCGRGQGRLGHGEPGVGSWQKSGSFLAAEGTAPTPGEGTAEAKSSRQQGWQVEGQETGPERREAGFYSVHVQKRGAWRTVVGTRSGGTGKRAGARLELGRPLQGSVGGRVHLTWGSGHKKREEEGPKTQPAQTHCGK